MLHTLAELVLAVTVLGVYTSTSMDIITMVEMLWGLLSKESTPVACLMQTEGTLTSVLGYIVKAITVRYISDHQLLV